jgi:hypothetical protein
MTHEAAELDLAELYRRSLGRYRLILLAGVLGGLLGIGVASLSSPRYRATAVLTIGIDHARSQWLDEDADGLAMLKVQELLLSDDVLEGVLKRTGPPGDADHPEISALREDLRLLWADERWELSAASSDPQWAAATANAWAEVGLEELREAVGHAISAAELQSFFFRVFCRPGGWPAGAEQPLWVCDEGDPSFETQGLPDDLVAEVEQSRGVIPPLTFALRSMASPPEAPETGARAVMAAAGLLAGLIVGTLGVAAAGHRRH